MDAQLIGLLAVGATLIGVVLVGLRGIRQDMDKRFEAFETKIDARFEAAEQLAKARFDAIDHQFVEVNGRLSALESGQADMRERMARLEGILEGLAFRTQVMPVSTPDEEA